MVSEYSAGGGATEINGVKTIPHVKTTEDAPVFNGPDSAIALPPIESPNAEDGFTAQPTVNGDSPPTVAIPKVYDGLSTQSKVNGVVPHSTTELVNGTHEKLPVVETDLLIVGTGPAGASLACFLTTYAMKGIMIGATPGCATTPRAHITNMAALECLRDLGLEDECIKQAAPNEGMLHTRWVRSMAGEEVARAYSWGNDPARKVMSDRQRRHWVQG